MAGNGKDKIIQEILDDIRRMFQAVNEQSKKAARQTGITGPQLWAIKIIGESSPVRVSDLAKRMYLNPSTVVGILDRLEANGLVARVRSRDDRRTVRVELTDKGKVLIARAPQVAQGLLVAGLTELSCSHLKNVASSLEELVHIMGAQELPPQLIHSLEVDAPDRTLNA